MSESPPPPRRNNKNQSQKPSKESKEKKSTKVVEKSKKLPFKRSYQIELPNFVVKGLFEKNGIKENPNNMILKIRLDRKTD